MTALVLVTGAPGSDKTTLAVPLAERPGVPLLAKDTIKEALFETLGIGDHAWSARLGGASFEVMFALAGYCPAAVLALGGPLLRVDTTRPVDVPAVAAWVNRQLQWRDREAARSDDRP